MSGRRLARALAGAALTVAMTGSITAGADDPKDASLSLLPVRNVSLRAGTQGNVLSVGYTQLYDRFSFDANLTAPFDAQSGLSILQQNSSLSSGIGLGMSLYYDTRIDPLSDAARLAILDRGVRAKGHVLKAACAIRYGRKPKEDEKAPVCSLSNVVEGPDYPQGREQLAPKLKQWCSAKDWRAGWVTEGLGSASAAEAQIDPELVAQWRKAVDQSREELTAAKKQRARFTKTMRKAKKRLTDQVEALLKSLAAVDKAAAAVDAANQQLRGERDKLKQAQAAVKAKRDAIDKAQADYAAAVEALSKPAAKPEPRRGRGKPKDDGRQQKVQQQWTALQLALVALQTSRVNADDARDRVADARQTLADARSSHAAAVRARDEADVRLSHVRASTKLVGCDTIATTLGQLAYTAWYASRVSQLEGMPFAPKDACEGDAGQDNPACKKVDLRAGGEFALRYNRREAYRTQDDVLVDVLDELGRPVTVNDATGNTYVLQSRTEPESFDELSFQVGAAAQLFYDQQAAFTLRAGLDAQNSLVTRQIDVCEVEDIDDPAYSVERCGPVDVLVTPPEWRYSGYVRGAATVLFTRPSIPAAGDDKLVYAPGGELRIAGERLGAVDPRVDITTILFASPGNAFMRGRIGIGGTLLIPAKQASDTQFVGFGFLGSAF